MSSTGSSDSFRVRVNLELEVTKVRLSPFPPPLTLRLSPLSLSFLTLRRFSFCLQLLSTLDRWNGANERQTTFSSGASSSTATATGQNAEPTASLQISGKVMNENDYVRLGAFHTLDLEG